MTLFPKRKTKDLDTNNCPIISKTLQQRKRKARITSRNKAFRAKTDVRDEPAGRRAFATQHQDSD
jgi:hypothetical protein